MSMAIEDTVASKKAELRQSAESEYYNAWRVGDGWAVPDIEISYITFEALIQIRQALVGIKNGTAWTVPTLPQFAVDNIVQSRAAVEKLRGKLAEVNAARDANDEEAVKAVTW